MQRKSRHNEIKVYAELGHSSWLHLPVRLFACDLTCKSEVAHNIQKYWALSCSFNRKELIRPMGVRRDGTLAPLGQAIHECSPPPSSDSDSDWTGVHPNPTGTAADGQPSVSQTVPCTRRYFSYFCCTRGMFFKLGHIWWSTYWAERKETEMFKWMVLDVIRHQMWCIRWKC